MILVQWFLDELEKFEAKQYRLPAPQCLAKTPDSSHRLATLRNTSPPLIDAPTTASELTAEASAHSIQTTQRFWTQVQHHQERTNRSSVPLAVMAACFKKLFSTTLRSTISAMWAMLSCCVTMLCLVRWAASEQHSDVSDSLHYVCENMRDGKSWLKFLVVYWVFALLTPLVFLSECTPRRVGQCFQSTTRIRKQSTAAKLEGSAQPANSVDIVAEDCGDAGGAKQVVTRPDVLNVGLHQQLLLEHEPQLQPESEANTIA
jgi:hypothetical protein